MQNSGQRKQKRRGARQRKHNDEEKIRSDKREEPDLEI